MQKSPKFRDRVATRMILAILLVILIPAIFISISFYLVSSNVIKNNVRESAIMITKQAADSLSFMITIGNDTSDLIYSNLKIQEAAKAKNLSFIEKNKLDEFVTSTLNNIVYSSSYVKIVYVIRDKDNSWGSGTFSHQKLSKYNLQDLSWVQEAAKKDGETVWQGLQYDLFSGAGDNTDLVLPVARVLKDFDTLQNIGYILVNINGRDLLKRISNIKLGKTGSFFVVNENGEIMIDEDLEQINTKINNNQLHERVLNDSAIEFEFDHLGIPYYGVKQPLINGWMLVGIVPIHEITEQLDSLQKRIVFSFVFITIIAIMIGFFIARRITRPIHLLTKQMRMVQEGDLKVRTSLLSKDEFGMMSQQFNSMLQKIEDLMEQVTLEQNKKLEAELRAVTHRINPHFLFNTLSTLRWLMKYNQTEKAYQGISALIRLLEANMGKKGNFITVAEEIDIIQKYLAILELRYHLTFQLDCEIDPKLNDYMIPRMFLQPLVENAIFHGLVPKNRNGKIQVIAREDADSIQFIISDNGIGMEEDKLQQIENIEEAIKNNQVGIGLRHVYESIGLYFGSGSLEIHSKVDEGTTITIRVVKKRNT